MGEHGGEPALSRADASGVDGWVLVAPGVRARAGAAKPSAGPRAPAAPARRPRTLLRARLRLVLAAAVVVLVILGAGLVEGVDADGGRAVAAAGQGIAPSPLGAPAPSPEGTGEPTADPGPTGDPEPAAMHEEPAIQDTDWWAVLEALDDRRARALEAVDPAALPAYAGVGSPAWQADEALMARLAQTGTHPVGLRSAVIAIESVAPCPDGRSACLEIVDQRGAYALVDAQGRDVGGVPQADPSRWRIALVATGQPSATEPGWRLREVVPLP